MDKPVFIMLIGNVGSGKSTFANELIEEYKNDSSDDKIIYLSSDDIREEILGSEENQGNNSVVFEEMKKRTIDALKNGMNVVYDATNINKKRRKSLLNQLPKNSHKTACYISTDFDTCLNQNNSRDRVVPYEVIDRFYKTLHLPVYSEGWDEIHYIHHKNSDDKVISDELRNSLRAEVLFNRDGYELIKFLSSYFKEFFKIYDLPHDSKYHTLSVSRHTYQVYRYILENYHVKEGHERDKEVMLWTALLHDIGKHHCKSFYNRKGEECIHANFIGHEYVGSQIAVDFLNQIGFDDKFIYEVSTLIQYHMYLLNKDASRSKLVNYVGEDMFAKLEILRDADTKAH